MTITRTIDYTKVTFEVFNLETRQPETMSRTFGYKLDEKLTAEVLVKSYLKDMPGLPFLRVISVESEKKRYAWDLDEIMPFAKEIDLLTIPEE